MFSGMPDLEDLKGVIRDARTHLPCRENVLSLALNTGRPEVVAVLLDAGADVHYVRPHGYDALLDALHGRMIARDPELVPAAAPVDRPRGEAERRERLR